jgi:hypothetical protein
MSDSHTEARHAERQRIKSILTCQAAEGCEALAEHLAFNSDISASQAIAYLNKVQAAPGEFILESAKRAGVLKG